jgi:beta-N-acetylhexosaminidase
MSSSPKSGKVTHAGRLLVIGFDGTEMSPGLADLLTRIQPGGVILFTRNMVNAQQTHRLLKACQACVREALLTCVDLEGGRVDRFRNVLGATPSPAEVFASGRPKLSRQHGEIIGRMCRSLGFNVDLAPVLDLAFESSRMVMATRAISTEPRQVIAYAREFLSGLRSARVMGAGKHFPGLGEGSSDSHHDLPVIQKSFKKLWEQDLLPYYVLRRELPIVLVSHANFPEVTRDKLPASLSKKWIAGVLRQRIGYRGLIASDDLEMGGVLKAGPLEEAAVDFIAAGGDLGLICHKQEFVESAFETLTREYERDRGFFERVNQSVRRIAKFKQAHAAELRPVPVPSPEKVERLSRQLWEFSERVRLYSLSATTGAGARG